MSKVAGCGAIAVAMVFVVAACSSSGLKGGMGGAASGGSGTGGKGAGGVTGVGGGTGGAGMGGIGTGGHAGDGAGGMGMGGEGAHGGSGAGGRDAGSPDAPDGSPDAISCCPPDPDPSRGGAETIIGEVHLGGPRLGFNACGPSFDFFCTINWHLVPDQFGCPVWTYDTDRSGNCMPWSLDGPISHADAGGN